MSSRRARGRAAAPHKSHNLPAASALCDLMTTEEVAQHCRTSPSTVRYWRHRGVGPYCYKVGRRVLYPRDHLHEWLREQQNHDDDRPD